MGLNKYGELESAVCPHCGKAIDESKNCLKCGTPLKSGWKACPKCGCKVSKGKSSQGLICKDVNKALWGAVLISDFETAQEALNQGADINSTYPTNPNRDETLVYYMCALGFNSRAKWVLDHGGDPNRASRFDETPLHRSLRKALEYFGRFGETMAEDLELMQILLDAGADVNAQDEFGQTVTKQASARGMRDVVDFLKKHGGK